MAINVTVRPKTDDIELVIQNDNSSFREHDVSLVDAINRVAEAVAKQRNPLDELIDVLTTMREALVLSPHDVAYRAMRNITHAIRQSAIDAEKQASSANMIILYSVSKKNRFDITMPQEHIDKINVQRLQMMRISSELWKLCDEMEKNLTNDLVEAAK